MPVKSKFSNTSSPVSAQCFGITLVEMLVVMALIAILASLVLPRFHTPLVTVRRFDAIVSLNSFAARLHQCYLITQDFRLCEISRGVTQASDQGYYEIRVDALSAHTFVVSASPIGTQLDDEQCLAYQLDQTQRRRVSGRGPASKCWRVR